MSKLLDKLHIHHDAPERDAAVSVPESQEVTEHHRRTKAPPHRAASGIRWLRWLGVIALFGGGFLAYTMFVNDEGNDVSQDVSSQQLVEESIDQAIADNQISTLDRAVLDLERSAIDQALVANQPATEFTPWLTPATGPGSNSLAATAVATPVGPVSFEVGRVPQPGMPDGYWQPAEAVTTSDAGQVLQPGLPDGYWQPAEVATTSDAGQVLQPGLPDGYWQQGG